MCECVRILAWLDVTEHASSLCMWFVWNVLTTKVEVTKVASQEATHVHMLVLN